MQCALPHWQAGACLINQLQTLNQVQGLIEYWSSTDNSHLSQILSDNILHQVKSSVLELNGPLMPEKVVFSIFWVILLFFFSQLPSINCNRYHWLDSEPLSWTWAGYSAPGSERLKPFFYRIPFCFHTRLCPLPRKTTHWQTTARDAGVWRTVVMMVEWRSTISIVVYGNVRFFFLSFLLYSTILI